MTDPPWSFWDQGCVLREKWQNARTEAAQHSMALARHLPGAHLLWSPWGSLGARISGLAFRQFWCREVDGQRQVRQLYALLGSVLQGAIDMARNKGRYNQV